jgi:hypothetical protein
MSWELLTAKDELRANRANAVRVAVGVFRAFGVGWEPGPSLESVKTAQVTSNTPTEL